MKKANERVLAEFHIDTNEIPPTDVFSGEIILFCLSNTKDTRPATLLDFLLYKDENTLELLKQAKSQVSIEKSIDGMMEEFMEIVSGKKPKITDSPIAHKTLHVE